MTKQIILTKEDKTHRTIVTKSYNKFDELIESETYTQHHDDGRETVIVENQPHQFSRDERTMKFAEAVKAYTHGGYFDVRTEEI